SRELLEGRPDPLVDAGRVAMQPSPKEATAWQRARLQTRHELVSVSHLDARAVAVRDGIEGAVEVAPAQRDHCLELAPRSADVLEPVGNADELHCDLPTLDLGELSHAPRWVYQPPPTGAEGARVFGRASSASPTTLPALAPSWKTTV